MRILITEANTKNSIALQRELSKCNKYFLIAVSSDSLFFTKLYNYCNRYIKGTLEEAVSQTSPDLIIPVGAASVLECSFKFKKLSFLPTHESIEFAFSKEKLSILNNINGVNYPKTLSFSSIEELKKFIQNGPCVVKSKNESKIKTDTIYFDGSIKDNLKIAYVEEMLGNDIKLLVQEKVNGVGRGFFCIAKEGEIQVYYMHERIREFPISGGSSTAAKSIYCKKLHDISISIIKYLNWNGPLMIEFKYDSDYDNYHLIELNPKFWGSLELSYAIGLSFGKCLVDLFNDEYTLNDSGEYKRGVKFYWILDGDLVVLAKTRKIKHVFDYFGEGSKNSIFISPMADFVKLIWTFKKILV
jgi:predicted ATP-grasp superfamily ATP-dependent carboligase